MRINPKSFTITLALTAILTASSALAATRPAKTTESRDDRGPRDPNVIIRIIDTIKRHVVHAMDGVIVNPPEVPH
jgi:hypothetical protein